MADRFKPAPGSSLVTSDFLAKQGAVPFWGPVGDVVAEKVDASGRTSFVRKSSLDGGLLTRQLGPWGIVYLGGVVVEKPAPNERGVKKSYKLTQIPGACDVKVSRSRKSKKESPSNAGFEVIIPDGIELASVTISVSIWTPAQFVAMGDMLDAIDPRASGKETSKNVSGGQRTLDNVTAFDVSHPALNMRKVRAIFINSIAGPDYETGGMVRFTINATEWVPGLPKGKPQNRVPESKQISGTHTLDNSAASESSGGQTGGFVKAPTPPSPRGPGK